MWCSIAAGEAGVFANPAYSPPSPAAETPELSRPAPLVRKTSIAALKATFVAKALPVLKNPLEAFQQRRSNSVKLPVPSQEAEVSTEPVCMHMHACVILLDQYAAGHLETYRRSTLVPDMVISAVSAS